MFLKNVVLYEIYNVKSRVANMYMHLSSQKYQVFSWIENNITNYYIFSSLPLGLSYACFMFTKIVRPHFRDVKIVYQLYI